MNSRKKARSYVLMYLYSLDINPEGNGDIDSVKPESLELSDEDQAFADSLIEKVKEHKSEIDDIITKHLRKWSLGQINGVDRNILRMMIAEYLYTDKDERLAPAILINEAVELTKEYTTGKSYRFVNGVLDNVFKEHHE